MKILLTVVMGCVSVFCIVNFGALFSWDPLFLGPMLDSSDHFMAYLLGGFCSAGVLLFLIYVSGERNARGNVVLDSGNHEFVPGLVYERDDSYIEESPGKYVVKIRVAGEKKGLYYSLRCLPPKAFSKVFLSDGWEYIAVGKISGSKTDDESVDSSAAENESC